MIKKLFSIILLCLLPILVEAADCTKYISPTGSGSTCSEASPCALSRAFSNGVADDVWCLRGGTYTLTGHLTTTNSGSSGHPIILQNYPGEIPTITNSSGYEIFIEDSYWTFDGVTVNCAGIPDHDHACINVGHNNDGSHFTIQNSTVYIASAAGHDNISCLRLQSNRSNYAYVYNNVFRGMGNLDCNMGDANDACNVGIQYLGGNNVGTKILKNTFYDNYLGIYIKHANADTSETGAEIAYNYMYDNTHGMYGVPVYVNYHDNLLVGCDFMFGDNGGGISGHYSTINHNTVYGTGKGIYLISQGSDVSGDTGAIHGMTITNNIFTAKTTESYAAGNTQTLQTSWDYNMYGDDAAIGAHDLGMTTPTFSGGANPTTVAGYSLTSESGGYHAGSDGKDMGADVTLVWSGEVDYTPSATLSGISVSGGSIR